MPFQEFHVSQLWQTREYQSVCKSNTRGGYFGGRRGRCTTAGWRGRGAEVKTLHGGDEEEPEDTAMNHVQDLNQICRKLNHPYVVDLLVDGIPLAMEIDTGACVSLISEKTFNKVFPNRVLKSSSTRLSAYSGHPLTTFGVLETVVSYGGQQETLPLLVVAGVGPSLLGRNWLSMIHLDWKSIRAIAHQPPVAPLLDKYSEVFDGGLGKLVGHGAKIHVDPSVQPCYCPARTVPYALRDSVEAELQRLHKKGIIEPVQFADWAAPIVAVVNAVNQNMRQL